MKNICKVLLLLIATAGTFISCKKEENKVFYLGGTSPVLSATVSGTIPLAFATKDNEAFRLSWTNPNYKFTTGLSSQDVSYLLEFDTTGANFTSPNKLQVTIGKDLSKSYTQNELNQVLFSNMKLLAGMPHNIEIRVISSLINNNAQLVSNVLKFTATPYVIPPKVTPPTTGKLYLVGNATPGGWANPVPVPSQEFTKLSNTLYQLTVNLVGGGSMLFLPLNGDWGTKFGAIGGNNSNNANGDEFRIGGGDLLAPAAAGTYKITVDFQAGTYTVVKQ
jgi:hypothetical protein